MIEQEIKCQLEASAFERLREGLGVAQARPRQQTNTYYDTADGALRQARAALRLREYASQGEWTYKQALDRYQSLELTQVNPQRLAQVPEALSEAWIYDDSLRQQLATVGVALTDLAVTCQFQTDRWTVDLGWGELVLDRTRYGDQVDYELELETQDLALAQSYVARLSAHYQFDLVPAAKKIARVSAYFAQQAARTGRKAFY